jgi:hypothetical protein
VLSITHLHTTVETLIRESSTALPTRARWSAPSQSGSALPAIGLIIT